MGHSADGGGGSLSDASTDADRVRNTIARFAQTLDGRRFEEWAGLFAEHGRFGQRNGRSEIFKSISHGELARYPQLLRKHAIFNVVVEFEGDVAVSTSDLVMFDCEAAGQEWRVAGVGRYDDRLVLEADGEWRFLERTLTWTDRSPQRP